ncbi:MAG: TetR/AcrR family transcriptional regulator [Clostridiales bacterium]|nr:TetR/AcrR family transcriptional regulator [Clostridiales bacterium]
MNDILKKLDNEKRDRIINSAIEEFSLYPFSKASTNNIVKNAGISKGLLFHYFGSKKDLYNYLSEFAIKKLFNEINDSLNWDETDIFERIKQVALAKLKMSHTYPKLFDFVISLFQKEKGSISVKDAVNVYEKYGVKIQEVFTKFYHYNIDYSLFKDQENITEKVDIIRWTIEKFSEEKSFSMMGTKEKFDFEKILLLMDDYLNVLKKAFY